MPGAVVPGIGHDEHGKRGLWIEPCLAQSIASVVELDGGSLQTWSHCIEVWFEFP
jgi:hypothetical protein